MTWNYRIVKYRDGSGFGLHEVMYDDDGEPWAMTADPCRFVCGIEEGPAGIKGSLLRARVDAIKRPIFDEPEEGKWPGRAPGQDEDDRKGPTFDSVEDMMAYLNRASAQ